MSTSYVDLLLLLLLLYHLLRGWQSGFIIGLLELLSWVGSLLLALRYYGGVAAWLEPVASLPGVLARPLAFALLAIAGGLGFLFLTRLVVSRIPARWHINPLNRLAGLLPGLINGLLFVAILASLLLALPLSGSLLHATRQSALASRFATLSARLEAELDPIFSDAISQTLNLLTIHPESDELVELPYTVGDATPAPELEQQMLSLINQERDAAGLPPLSMDPALIEVARRHSGDMFQRGYFAHTTPEGLTPFDRIQASGIRYVIAGENLALAPTLLIAHNGLMDSPGHRANILSPDFGRVGIGILDGGPRGLMVTQNFRD